MPHVAALDIHAAAADAVARRQQPAARAATLKVTCRKAAGKHALGALAVAAAQRLQRAAV